MIEQYSSLKRTNVDYNNMMTNVLLQDLLTLIMKPIVFRELDVI